MFSLFNKNETVTIVTDRSASEAVLAACGDLKRDLLRMSGKKDGFEVTGGEGRGICIAENTALEREGYRVEVTDNGVNITGADELGMIYGIYAFEEKMLGISPMFRFTDIFPEQTEKLEIVPDLICSESKAVRFRGWFLNDEDLLTDFREGGGNRKIDYPFYEHVMHEDVLEMVLETALRLQMNLIIPSSFVDIENPDEERLIRQTTRRGLYITMHHVEPLGVSWFGAENYMKKHGETGEVSFVSNRPLMEKIWRHYVSRWAEYEKYVIWQLGLRGKADRAVWSSDPSVPNDREMRGKIITDAIALQYQIVAETLGHENFESTTTLWLEGAELYSSGALKVPQKTTAIFCDIGFNQMFGDDFYSVDNKKGCRYGIYYHVAYWDRGPHLAECCAPEKMLFSYREAAKKDRLCYSLLNTTNVREMHFSIRLNAMILKDPGHFDLEKATEEILTEIFGDKAEIIAAIRKEYYKAFAELSQKDLEDLCKAVYFHYHEYGSIPFRNFAADDGTIRFYCGKPSLRGEVFPEIWAKELEESAERFHDVYDRYASVLQELPDTSQMYLKMYPMLQSKYMEMLTRWVLACRNMAIHKNDSVRAKQYAEEACGYIERILSEREICEQGNWTGWYNGDRKIGVKSLAQVTMKALEDIT